LEEIKAMTNTIEYRIAYNPDTKDYISGYNSHSIQLYNKGKEKIFDEYIRGIIINNTLYLRLYYPFNNIDTLTRDKIYQASYELLKDNIFTLIKEIETREGFYIIDVVYNVDNDILKGMNLANI